MLNSVTIRIDQHEYSILRNVTHYYLDWCYAHFYFQKSMSIEPEPIAALMYERYFSKEVDMVRFGRQGKALTISYPEAKALYNLLSLENSLGMINIRGKIDKELTDWRPSLSKIRFKDWYESSSFLRDTFGEFSEMSEQALEISIEIFNKEKS